MPQTTEGAACLAAAEAAISGGGMIPVAVDMAGALALARAAGVPGKVAAPLLMAAAEGVRIGAYERMDKGEP